MVAAFLLILLLGPVVELVAGAVVASHIGVLNTLAVTAACSLLGLVLLKFEGLAALRRVRSDLRQGRSPGRGLVDGLLRMTGVVLLALPGLVSSSVGLLLLLPPVRALLTPLVAAVLARRAVSSLARFRIGTVVLDADGRSYRRGFGFDATAGNDGGVIDTEGWDVSEQLPLPPGGAAGEDAARGPYPG